MWATYPVASAVLGASVLMIVAAMPARAQAFADLKTALVDYSKADMEPRKACEALGKFKSKEIAQITAATMPATAARAGALSRHGSALARDRVRGEPAGEVERPLLHDRQRRPRGRGAGRSRPRRAAQRGVAARVRLRADQHRPRRAQGAGRHLRAEQSAEGDRLRLSRGAPHGHRPPRTSRRTTTASRSPAPTGTPAPTADARA